MNTTEEKLAFVEESERAGISISASLRIGLNVPQGENLCRGENSVMRKKKSLRQPKPTRRPSLATEIIFSVEEAPEGGYMARAVGESIFTEADNIKQLYAQVRDAVRCHFPRLNAPRVIRLHFVREEVLAV